MKKEEFWKVEKRGRGKKSLAGLGYFDRGDCGGWEERKRQEDALVKVSFLIFVVSGRGGEGEGERKGGVAITCGLFVFYSQDGGGEGGRGKGSAGRGRENTGCIYTAIWNGRKKKKWGGGEEKKKKRKGIHDRGCRCSTRRPLQTGE